MNNQIQYSFERREKKYFLTPAQHAELLNRLASAIEQDAFGSYSIGNIYYDTDDFKIIRTSLAKPAYKEKLRVRSYGVPAQNDDVFIELKKKVEGVVYKRRITTQAQQAQALLADNTLHLQNSQISHEIAWFQSIYHAQPKVFIGYDRTAFSGIENPDLRITFDRNMRFRTHNLDLCHGLQGTPLLSSERILMELKLPGTCPVWLSHILSGLAIFPVSFSKYGHCYCKHILPEQILQQKGVRLSA